jgi:hypothetical protein
VGPAAELGHALGPCDIIVGLFALRSSDCGTYRMVFADRCSEGGGGAAASTIS